MDLDISEVSTLTRQALSHLLDAPDRLGKDWCLLAVKMGLTDKVRLHMCFLNLKTVFGEAHDTLLVVRIMKMKRVFLLKVPKLEGGNKARGQSQTAKLLDEWERRGNSNKISE